jgi:hypothetical protein
LAAIHVFDCGLGAQHFFALLPSYAALREGVGRYVAGDAVGATAAWRRLVRDATLLGPEPVVATDLVDRVLGSIADARHDPLSDGAMSDGAMPDRGGWLTSEVSSLPDDRFVLAGPMQAGSTQAGSIAIRVLLER